MKALCILCSLTRSTVKEHVKISVFGAERMNVIVLESSAYDRDLAGQDAEVLKFMFVAK